MRPIAVVTPKDLWWPVATEFQIGVLPLYHRHSDRFGTMSSFHATTTCARYTEKGSASIRLLGVARPADDLVGELTGAFGAALRASMRTRQAGRAHVCAQLTSTGAVPGWQRRTARNASDMTRRDASSSHGGRAEGEAEPPGPWRSALARVRASAGQIRSPAGAAWDPTHFRPEQGRARATSQTQRVSRGDVNHAPARGSRQQRQDHVRDVLAQGGSEDAVGAAARAGRASSGARPSSGDDRDQCWLCSKYVTCMLFKAVEKSYP